MFFKILRHEMQAVDVRSNRSVRTKVPKEHIGDNGELVLPLLRGSNLSAGDHILVQCMDHDYSEVLWEADFVIWSARTGTQTIVTDGGEHQATVTTYRLARRTDWWSPLGAGAAQTKGAPPSPPVPPAPTDKRKAAA